MRSDAPRYLARSTSLAASLNDGGLVILTPTHCAVVTLNEVAAAIWLAADGLTTLAEIVEHVVCGKFDIEPYVARRDAETFVEDLLRHGILVPGERPIVNAPVAALHEFATRGIDESDLPACQRLSGAPVISHCHSRDA